MTMKRTAKSIFLSALELDSASERGEFLRSECGDDKDLQNEVARLLANQPGGSFLESPLVATIDRTSKASPSRERTGSRIGPYKIRELLGEGGMGEVYVAEQERPLRRKVALKVIKSGMDSQAVLRRFEAERNALALMNHPNIAKVLDAGTTDAGRPYFAMELVSGIPITEYCDEQKLSIQDRLELFVDVCSAIQHAHQKGIIHRDIKPSNVLVTLLDGKPIAKVIDFGVAKALNQSLTEHSLYTAHRTVIGTPLYMSPEQASFSAVDVDTRSDVYSLGVLLYELLTGTTPYSRGDLQRVSQDEVFRFIRESEPPRPSNRISSLGDTANRISQSRQTQPDQLGRKVKGDLDWIVMKALRKERSKRYESAASFGDDVSRHLRSDVIEARPPTLGYQLKKLHARNRQAFQMLGVVLAALLIVFGLFVDGYFREKALVQERDQTIEQLRKSRQDLYITNKKIRDRNFERVFELAQSGEVDLAQGELETLISTSIDEDADRIRLYSNIVKLFGRDSQRIEAREDLIALDRERSNLLVKSMKVLGYIQTDEEWAYWDTVGDLQPFEPTVFEEYLFRGAALAYGASGQSRADLKEAVKLRPNSAAAHVLLSSAIQSVTMNEVATAELRLENAKSALFEARVGMRISKPGDVNAIVAALDAHASLFLCLNERDDDAARVIINEHLSSWRALFASSLDLSYDSVLHRAQLDSYRILSRHGDPMAKLIRRQVLRELPDGHVSGEVVIKMIQLHYAAGEIVECEKLCSRYRDDINGYDIMGLLPLIEREYREGGREQMQKYVLGLVDAQDQDFTGITGLMNRPMLLLVGESIAATHGMKTFREWAEEDRGESALLDKEIWMEMMGWLEGRGGNVQAERFASTCEIEHIKCDILFGLAIDSLLDNRRNAARKAFGKVGSSSNFRMFRCAWAQIFEERLDDPRFLPWLETEKEEP